MSGDDKQKRSDALKDLEAARKGSKKRMEQYEEGVSEEEIDEEALEEYLKDKKSNKRKKKTIPASHDITKFMTGETDTNAMANVSPPRKRIRNETDEKSELLGELDRRKQIFGESSQIIRKEIIPAPSPNDLPEIAGIESVGNNLMTNEKVELKMFTVNDKKAVRLYWFDACELSNVIYLIGKAETVKNTLVSCCAVVEDMQRSVYLLPREFAETPFTRDLNNPSEGDADLANQLKTALANLCEQQGIEPRMKFVKKRYAFEQPGIPYEETTYLKLSYPYRNTNALVLNPDHPVFSKAFGVSQSALELFLLKKKIKGPCWLEVVSSGVFEQDDGQNKTWCRAQLNTSTEKIGTSRDQSNIPQLSVMSLKIKTYLNEELKVNEIVAISGVVHNGVVIDGPTPNIEAGYRKFNLVRKVNPNDDNLSIDGKEVLLPNELSLLNVFMNKLHTIDPDILVGHNFIAYDLDVLLHRMAAKGIRGWSKLGRLKRSNFPKLQSGPGGMSESTFEEKRVLAGRLVCDTYLASKEYLKESSYALLALAVSQLNAEEIKEDIVQESDMKVVRHYLTRPEGVNSMIKHLEYNALIGLRLMFKLSLLPLSKELTNIAGNLWSRTLTGSRAERVEYLLLHEFFNRKYIIPDKSFSSNGFSNIRRKAAYSGGLVLEPKRGLYDKYVLLLDFNSLYPSIILENNICFTTIVRPRKEPIQPQRQAPSKKGKKPAPKTSSILNTDSELANSEVPETQAAVEEEPVFEAQPPEPGLQQAVLPSVIGGLLAKRRSAKFEMGKAAKDKDKIREWQYNIKQSALKLTANSTYGCLGFQHSRFYCQAMAELITRLGRGILRSTKDRIEQSKDLGHTVIYGDTDSVMVLTSHVNYDDAYKVGEQIQAHINKGNKYLEIGIDGLFRRILLLRKKKYVAIVHSKKDGQVISTVENKGIDMVRRDWSELSRDVSQFCVNQILKTANSDEGDDDSITSEDVVNAIHQHLREVKEEVIQMQLPLSKYIITKGLTKAPEDYPDASHHPHVQVAVEMKKRGIPVRVGQRIPYVICSKCTNPNPKTIADKAVHPQIFEEMNKKAPGTFIIDAEWYLSQQIYPPIFRLCEHMEGTDGKMLADCLGLDKHKYSGSGSSSYDDINGHLDYVMMSDMHDDDDDKYRRVKVTPLKCSRCEAECRINISEQLVNYVQKKIDDPSFNEDLNLLSCATCNTEFSCARLCNWVQKDIRQQLQRYYSGWMTVPHHIVKAGLGQNRTRVASLTPKNAIVGGMIVNVREEFSAQDLQLHLQYDLQMFDWEKAIRKAEKHFKLKPNNGQHLKTLDIIKTWAESEDSLKTLAVVKNKVQRFLQKSGRQWVHLDDLFSAVYKLSISN